MTRDALALLPEMIVLLGALGCLIGGSFTPRREQWRIRVVALLALAGALAATVVAWSVDGSKSSIFDGTFAIDTTTHAARLIVGAASLLVVVLAGADVAGTPRESETYVLLLFLALGTQVLAGATDLLLLITGYLLASIPLYALLGLGATRRAAESALKAYLLGALLGIVMMTGVSVLYGVTGVTSYAELGAALSGAPDPVVVFGAVAVLAGLLFKAGGVPGHFWVPDAAEGATVTAATAATTIPKIGAAIALYRLTDLLPTDLGWAPMVGAVAVVSMTLGNLAAFAQTNARRLLGWSTVSQIGYLLVAVAVAGRAGLALPSLLAYLAAYVVTNVAVFAVTATVPGRRSLADYRGLARERPALAAALVVGLLGLVGTPPTGIFIGKLTVATAAWDGGLAWLALALVLNSVASLFYYLRWVAAVFTAAPDAPTPALDTGTGPSTSAAAVVALSAAGLSVLLGLGSAVFF